MTDVMNEAWEVCGSPYAIRSKLPPFSMVLYLQQLSPMPSEALAQRIVDDHNRGLGSPVQTTPSTENPCQK